MTEELEPTCKMERDELVGLLETTTAPERQRITSEIPSMTLHDLLRSEIPPELSSELGWSITHRLVVVATSFVVTLAAGIAILLA